jgi:hypothetical protein
MRGACVTLLSLANSSQGHDTIDQVGVMIFLPGIGWNSRSYGDLFLSWEDTH